MREGRGEGEGKYHITKHTITTIKVGVITRPFGRENIAT